MLYTRDCLSSDAVSLECHWTVLSVGFLSVSIHDSSCILCSKVHSSCNRNSRLYHSDYHHLCNQVSYKPLPYQISTDFFPTRSRDGREYVWHGVWSLVLLLYAPLVHTCLNLLQCPFTPSADGEEEALVSPSHDVLCHECTYLHPQLWYLDGAVKCFQDPSHTALGVIAIFVLLALVLLVPAVFVFTVIASSKQIQVH